MYQPCDCGAHDCPSCTLLPRARTPRRSALGSLSAEDIDLLNEDAYRAEHAAADEEAERYYRRYVEDGPDAETEPTDRL
jgi:hypothetical protein